MTTARTFSRRIGIAAVALGAMATAGTVAAAPASAASWSTMKVLGSTYQECNAARVSAVRALTPVSHQVKSTACRYTGADNEYVGTVRYR